MQSHYLTRTVISCLCVCSTFWFYLFYGYLPLFAGRRSGDMRFMCQIRHPRLYTRCNVKRCGANEQGASRPKYTDPENSTTKISSTIETLRLRHPEVITRLHRTCTALVDLSNASLAMKTVKLSQFHELIGKRPTR